MESYSFRPKPNGFPKLTNSTWYKTYKFSKTKNKSANNLNPNNLSNYETSNTGNTLKNFHSPIPVFGLKKKLNSSKFRRKIRSSSVPSQNISSQETDDSLFALSQIRNLDRFISKRINKKTIWKERTPNIYEINTSRNCKEIKNIRDRIHQSRFEDSKNFDLKYEINRKKYFPVEKVAIVNDAKVIIKKMEDEFNKNKSVSNFFVKKRVDIQTFAVQNREICFRNNMINILNEEKNKIKQIEKDYAKALVDANKGFLKDKETFEQFIVQHKILTKQKELEVEEAKRNRKKLRDELNKINLDIRIKQDEIEKQVKDILSCFSYAEFIYRIIGRESMKNININRLIIKPSRNRSKDINYLINTTFELFGFLLEDGNGNGKNNDINFDAEQMTYLFNSLEAMIMKHIDERDNIIKEMETQNDYSELIFLQKKKSQHQEELKFLQNELDYLINTSQPIDEDYKENLDKAQKYIGEIFLELNDIKGINNKFILNQRDEEDDITKIVINILHNIENKLIFYMNEIETIENNQKENDDIFKNVIEKIKIENKRIKYKNSKKLLEQLEEEKMMKYQQRMNRVKIRSIVEFMPPWIKKKRKKKKIVKTDSKEEEKQLLFYH